MTLKPASSGYYMKTNWRLGCKKQTVTIGDPNLINNYFTSMAYDPNYSRDAVMQALIKDDINIVNDNYSRDTIELMLAHIARTATGNDEMPYWLYRDCASELANVVSKLIYMSVDMGEVPRA